MSGILVRILIVDDEASSVHLLRGLLRKLGRHEIRVAYSAAKALEAAVEFIPDIVFLDIELPDMSGYDVGLLMHQHALLQRMRLIALTNSGEHPGREQARACGFERYIVKPITIEAVREVLGNC